MHELVKMLIIAVLRGRHHHRSSRGDVDVDVEREVSSHDDDVVVDDEEAIEAECYFLFAGLMKGNMERLYDPNDPEYLSDACARVQSTLLGRAAPDLQRRFHEMRIAPNVYLVRWLRCLFTREFTLERSFQVLDALVSFSFAEKEEEEETREDCPVVESACFIALAMLVSLKDRLMASASSSEALSLLLNYPRLKRAALRDVLSLASNLRALGDVPP